MRSDPYSVQQHSMIWESKIHKIKFQLQVMQRLTADRW
jgi:hypothetical protein